MLEFDFELLSTLGLNAALASRAAAAAAADDTAKRLLRITEVHRETLRLHDGQNELHARTLPALIRALAADDTALAVGDWVLAGEDAQGALWARQRIAPSSHIARRDGDGRRHAVVSNVDTALLVMGLDDDFNPRRLERFLALVHASAVLPVVVLTKADIAAREPALRESRVAALRERIAAHIDLLCVDATDAASAALFAAYAGRGQTLVLLGSSGAGKSTLTNTLLGGTVQDTGAVRAHDSRGKHTTTSRSLHRLASGACVIDTPGLRTLRPDGGEASVAASFDDVERLAALCRFRDCGHIAEPGCAVREGVDADRLRNYHKLLREARRDTMSALDRQKQLAQWKSRGREARERIRSKRGEA